MSNVTLLFSFSFLNSTGSTFSSMKKDLTTDHRKNPVQSIHMETTVTLNRDNVKALDTSLYKHFCCLM